MNIEFEKIAAFIGLFSGNRSVRGKYTPPNTVTEQGEKEQGESYTVHGVINSHHYIKHLHGKEGLGIVPIREDDKVTFCAIDVDDYAINAKKYISLITRSHLPIVPCKSKSGGLHLYLFFAKPVPAKDARKALEHIRDLFNLPKNTEIFPKQVTLHNAKSAGNWINIPYFNRDNTNRYAYDNECKPLNFHDAIAVFLSLKTTIKDLKELIENVPLSDAPPCLQTIFLSNKNLDNARNIYLFNLASFCKAKFKDTFADELKILNKRLHDPLEEEELERTLLKSHKTHDYAYQCAEGLLKAHCNKALCSERKYGRDSASISNLNFEQLIQVQTSKPYYKWIVNGVEILFSDEKDLTNQELFRQLCIRHLHTFPHRLKDIVWVNILNRALKHIKVETVDKLNELTEDTMWLSTLKDYLSRSKALNPSQINDGLVWVEDSKIYVKGSLLLGFLKANRQLGKMTNAEHTEKLKLLGGEPLKLYCPDTMTQTRAWCLDKLVLEGYGFDFTHFEKYIPPEEAIDFTEKEEF